MGTLTVIKTMMLPSDGSGFHAIDLDTRCAKNGKGFAWDGQPPLSRHQLLVVFVRCHEHPQCMLQQLQAQRVPFLVYVAFLRTSSQPAHFPAQPPECRPFPPAGTKRRPAAAATLQVHRQAGPTGQV